MEKKKIKSTEMTAVELTKKAAELRQQIKTLTMQLAVKRERNTKKKFNHRKELARVLTALKNKTINVVK
jgi:ribosomal protein L29